MFADFNVKHRIPFVCLKSDKLTTSLYYLATIEMIWNTHTTTSRIVLVPTNHFPLQIRFIPTS